MWRRAESIAAFPFRRESDGWVMAPQGKGSHLMVIAPPIDCPGTDELACPNEVVLFQS
jgi:hypothetical protein